MSISITIILISLIFALSNGLHDASSVVATCIVCGAATPKQAIGIASFFGMIGSVFGGSAVADLIMIRKNFYSMLKMQMKLDWIWKIN